MSIQDLENQNILLGLWNDFNTRKFTLDIIINQVTETIASLESNELYDTTASTEEKALVAEYKTKLGIS